MFKKPAAQKSSPKGMDEMLKSEAYQIAGYIKTRLRYGDDQYNLVRILGLKESLRKGSVTKGIHSDGNNLIGLIIEELISRNFFDDLISTKLDDQSLGGDCVNILNSLMLTEIDSQSQQKPLVDWARQYQDYLTLINNSSRQTQPYLAQLSPAPTQSSPAPTQSSPAPTQSSPAPTQSSPAPTQSSPAPTKSSPLQQTLSHQPTSFPNQTLTPHQLRMLNELIKVDVSTNTELSLESERLYDEIWQRFGGDKLSFEEISNLEKEASKKRNLFVTQFISGVLAQSLQFPTKSSPAPTKSSPLQQTLSHQPTSFPNQTLTPHQLKMLNELIKVDVSTNTELSLESERLYDEIWQRFGGDKLSFEEISNLEKEASKKRNLFVTQFISGVLAQSLQFPTQTSQLRTAEPPIEISDDDLPNTREDLRQLIVGYVESEIGNSSSDFGNLSAKLGKENFHILDIAEVFVDVMAGYDVQKTTSIRKRSGEVVSGLPSKKQKTDPTETIFQELNEITGDYESCQEQYNEALKPFAGQLSSEQISSLEEKAKNAPNLSLVQFIAFNTKSLLKLSKEDLDRITKELEDTVNLENDGPDNKDFEKKVESSIANGNQLLQLLEHLQDSRKELFEVIIQNDKWATHYELNPAQIEKLVAIKEPVIEISDDVASKKDLEELLLKLLDNKASGIKSIQSEQNQDSVFTGNEVLEALEEVMPNYQLAIQRVPFREGTDTILQTLKLEKPAKSPDTTTTPRELPQNLSPQLGKPK